MERFFAFYLLLNQVVEAQLLFLVFLLLSLPHSFSSPKLNSVEHGCVCVSHEETFVLGYLKCTFKHVNAQDEPGFLPHCLCCK